MKSNLLFVLLAEHLSPKSYYYLITNEYFGIAMILFLLALVIFSVQTSYFNYLLTHLFSFPDVARKRNQYSNEPQNKLLLKTLNTVFLMGTIALSFLMILKPYDGSPYEHFSFLAYDNYLIWFAMLLVLIILVIIRQVAFEVSLYFLPDNTIIREWDQNTLNASYLSGFAILALCTAYILGYTSSSNFKYLLIILASISLIIRGLISVVVSGRFNFVGRFNFFLYLCTLEILPGLVGMKFILDLLN